MAKDDKAKVKMTVIQFETESDNATLQENIRAIANTLTRALASPPRIAQPPAQLASGDGASNGAAGQATEVGSDDDAIDADIISTPQKKAKTAARQMPTPKPLDLELATGDVPLKTFLEKKKPDGDNKRYLVIAYWLKTYRNINEITMDHAYTCYRTMGWNVPKDASSPLRQMKKQGWMNRGTGKGAYAINHIGENVINEMNRTEQAP
jgi:hypothetical protein